MTNLEAIKAKLNYPLTDNAFILALQDRGLASAGIYSSCEAFDLAYADTITTLVTSPDTREGSNYQISLTDKTALMDLADGIYNRYSALNPLKSSLKKTATFVQRF